MHDVLSILDLFFNSDSRAPARTNTYIVANDVIVSQVSGEFVRQTLMNSLDNLKVR